MTRINVSASVLAADFANLGRDVRAAQEAGCDEIHFDVMDGRFVPNLSVGIPVLQAIRPVTRLPIDVHMMVEEPSRFDRVVADAGGDIFTVHIEGCADPAGAAASARTAGMRPAVSIKPATPVRQVEPYLREFDRILVMTVEPGFGGQSFMPEVLVKVDQLRDLSSRGGLSSR